MSVRTGLGFDVHAFAPGRPLVLGGVEIPGTPGLLGHSDADVLCHAVMDALLGAAAEGDIGMHFPDTDERWRGARSVLLLEQVAALLRAKGLAIVHVDSTLLAQRPRVAPFVAAMRENMARAMGVGPGSVSVKATTTERLGAIGRSEGIAAMAVGTVEGRG